jgi:hypothetical protein
MGFNYAGVKNPGQQIKCLCVKVKTVVAVINRKNTNSCGLPGSHNVECFYQRGSLEGKDQRQPFPMRIYREDQSGSRSQENQPPDSPVLFGFKVGQK